MLYAPMQHLPRFFSGCLFLCLMSTTPAFAQFYLGYRVGRYTTAEIPPQIYAGKFNAGWEFSASGGGALLFFDPGPTRYKIDNYMEWGNIPHGISFGFLMESSDKLGLQLGFYQFNQGWSGKRTNLTTAAEETFSMKSKSGGITLNIVIGSGRLRPYFGADMGTFRLAYSFKNDEYDIKKQRIGFTSGLLGSGKAGDRALYARFNFGTTIKLADFGKAELLAAPQYQLDIAGMEELNRLPYADHIFNHKNFSLALLLYIPN